MSIIHKIKSVKNTITKLLTSNKSLRDNDNQLLAIIWYNEAVRQNQELTAKEFLVLLGQGKLSNPEAITRARRKIQQQNTELRGKNYQGRLKEEIDVRRTINTV